MKLSWSLLILVGLSIWFPTNSSATVVKDGDQLRHLIADVVEVLDPNHSAQQISTALIEVLSRNEDLIERFAHGDLNTLLADANLHLPESKVDQVLQSNHLTRILNHLRRTQESFSGLLFFPINPLVSTLTKSSLLITKSLLPSVPFIDTWLYNEARNLTKDLNAVITDFDVKDSDLMDQLLDPKTGLDLSKVPEKLRPQLVDLLCNFYRLIDLPRKRKIVINYFRLPASSDFGQIIAQVISDSGPIIVKLAQLFREYTPAHVAASLRKLLDDLPPRLNSQQLAKAMVELKLEENGYQIFEFDSNPLAVASVGQVHKGVLLNKTNNTKEDVIIKFIDPKTVGETDADFKKIKEALSHMTTVQPLITALHEALLEELDLRREAAKFTMGVKAYGKGKPNIHPVGVLAGSPVSAFVMIQKKAPGKSFARWANTPSGNTPEFLRAKAENLLDLLDLWFKNAVFGDGFIHADLHGGNLFMTMNEDHSSELSLIDFGSTAQLTAEEQAELIHLGAALFYYEPDAICQSLRKLSMEEPGQSEVQDNLFRKLKEHIINRQVNTPYHSMYDELTYIITEAINLGIIFHPNFVQFNRGRIFIEEQYTKTIQQLTKEPNFNALANILDAYIRSSTKGMISFATRPFSHKNITNLPLMSLSTMLGRRTLQWIYAFKKDGVKGLWTDLSPMRTNQMHFYRAFLSFKSQPY